MNWQRLWRHVVTDHRAAHHLFPAQALHRLELATKHGEQVHHGQVRLAIEASLPLAAVRRNVLPRARAIEMFGMLRVWDTAENCGVLVYLLLADRDVEIVADRGIHAKVGDAQWEAICRSMETAFRGGRYKDGVIAGIAAVTEQLALHFPATAAGVNELPDKPAVI